MERHLELLYESGFKSFPTLKLQNSRVGQGLISQAIWFWSLYIKRRNEGGALIRKYPN